MAQAIERVKLAEALGYHSAFVTPIAGRESLTVVTRQRGAGLAIPIDTGADRRLVPDAGSGPISGMDFGATLRPAAPGRDPSAT